MTILFRGMIAVIITSLWPVLAVAQEDEVQGWTTETLPDVDTILREFQCEVQDPRGPCVGLDPIVWIKFHPHQVSPQIIMSLLDGLESIALTSDVQVVRQGAVAYLVIFADDPSNGILCRLLRIYKGTEDHFVRSSILGHLAANVERSAAVAFLTRVAQQDSANEDFPGSAERAVRSLGLAGPMGADALQDLHARGLVKDPEALMLLETFAKHGYQVRDRE